MGRLIDHEIRATLDRMEKLLAKPDAPRQRDSWDKLGVLTAFIASVLIAAVSLLTSVWFQNLQHQQQKDAADAQVRLQTIEAKRQRDATDAQIRVAELDAISKLIPALTSTDADTKDLAYKILEAVQAQQHSDSARTADSQKSMSPTVSPAPRTGGIASDVSLVSHFAAIAMASHRTVSERRDATKTLGEMARTDASAAVRTRAEDAVHAIAASPSVPIEVRQTAEEIIRQIRKIPPSDIARTVAMQSPGDRQVSMIVLHHSGFPGAARYNERQVLAIAQHQLYDNRWKSTSWHYAIAPDGNMWLGMPLNTRAIHVANNAIHATSVSILLILDGDTEHMTDAQKASLTILLRALRERLNLDLNQAVRFHSDIAPQKSCPGKLIVRNEITASATEDVHATRSETFVDPRIPTIVLFTAYWSSDTRKAVGDLDKLAERKDIKYTKINVDDDPFTGQMYGVTRVPMTILFVDGKERDRVVGYLPERLKELVTAATAAAAPQRQPPPLQ